VCQTCICQTYGQYYIDTNRENEDKPFSFHAICYGIPCSALKAKTEELNVLFEKENTVLFPLL
jgi:hypothetical protein